MKTLSHLFVLTALLLAAASYAAEPLVPVFWGQQWYDGRDFDQPVTSISVGPYHTAVLKADGTVTAMGRNQEGQCIVPEGMTGVSAIAAGYYHTVALKSDGSVVAWGQNLYGQCDVPVGLTGVASIAAGGGHTVAVKTDGSVVAWGYDNFGQITVPMGLSGVIAVKAGINHTLALKTDGSVIAWGRNDSGQSTVPAGLSGVTAISAGAYFSVALKTNGSVVAWGQNHTGQTTVPAGLSEVIGISAGSTFTVALKSDGSIINWGSMSSSPATVPAGLSGVVAVSAGASRFAALKTDGSFVTWGNETSLAYGANLMPENLSSLSAIDAGSSHTLALRTDGTVFTWGSISSPPAGLSGVAAVSAGVSHALALKSDGSVVAWGSNSAGQCDVPDGLTGVTSISAGGAFNLALKTDATVVAWGANHEGQSIVPAGLTGVVAISAGGTHAIALKNDGTIVAWGRNVEGQTTVPAGLSGVAAICAGNDNTVILKTDGSVLAWGYDAEGQIDVPDGLSGVAAIATGGRFAVALKTDGSVVGWGRNVEGQTTAPAGLSGIVSIDGGGRFTVALVPAPAADIPELAVFDGMEADAEISNNGSAQDFGSAATFSGTVTRTFTIANNGVGQLTMGNLTVGGAHAADFTVTQVPTSPVMPTGSTTFQVTFSPSANGLRSATLSFRNNAPGKDPFSFSLEGTGFFTGSTPTIEVSGNGQLMVNGDTTPDAADGSDWGAVALLNTQVSREFTIQNSGDVALNLTGTPRVQFLGLHGADFKLTTPPDASVAVGENTSFAVTFDPRLPGLRTAVLSIATNDPDRNPFMFAVSGFGAMSRLLTQKITFTAPGTVYLSEGPLGLLTEASSGLPVTLEVVSGPGTLMGSVLTPTGTGKVTLRATQAGGGNYAAAKAVTRVITVKADPSVLTLTGLSQRYDGAPKAIGTVGAAGMVEISYKVGGVFGATAPTAVGRYPVQAVADGVTKKGTLVITKAPLYVVPQNERKFAGEVNPTLTLVYEGFVGGDDAAVLTTVPVLTTTAKTTSPGGTYPITAKGGVAANYTLIYRQGTMVVESFAAGYEALLVDGLDVPSGKLSLTVARSGKSFSGSMALAGETTALRVSGPLVSNSNTELATGDATVVRNGVTYTLDFALPMYGEVTGAVTRAGLALATAEGGRRLWVLPKGMKVNYIGAHTVVLEPAQPAGAGVPAGAGWARAAINAKGAIALVGKLGDGTSFTTSLLADVEETPGYRLWVQPYKPVRVETFLGGVFEVQGNLLGGGGFVAGGVPLVWSKAERLGDKSYPLGFVPVAVGLTLDPWVKPSASASLSGLLGLSGGSIEVQHSATGSASDGDLPTTVTLSAGNAVSVPGGSNPTRWKTKFNTKNGTFTGSFELMDAGVKRVASFSGILRQPIEGSDEVIGNGHFLIPEAPSGVEKVTGQILVQRP